MIKDLKVFKKRRRLKFKKKERKKKNGERCIKQKLQNRANTSKSRCAQGYKTRQCVGDASSRSTRAPALTPRPHG